MGRIQGGGTGQGMEYDTLRESMDSPMVVCYPLKGLYYIKGWDKI